MMQKNSKNSAKLTAFLWTASGLLFTGLVFFRVVYPENLAPTVLCVVLLVATLGALIVQNQKALKGRTTAYGLNSAVTVILVLGILGVVNFLSFRYPLKWDLTKNKLHTLSDQTTKVVQGLKEPVRVTYFATTQEKEQNRSLLENYRNLSPKFELQFVDPVREPTRAKQAGLKKDGTLLLSSGVRESKVEDISEEKLTNALIKLLKDKSPTLCSLTGHGERSFNSKEAEGYESAKKALTDQSYVVKELNLLQEGKVPADCDAVAILGPTKSFFAAEVKALETYFNGGGRGVIALDLNLKPGEYTPELLSLLKAWHIKPESALIVDPVSRFLNLDSSVALLASFSKDNPISKDFQANCAFPLARPLEIIPGAPAGMNVQWLAQSTPKSWGVMDLGQISKGEVRFNAGKDKQGPLNVAIAVEGKQKDSSATKNTRLVVFGSSLFATNNFGRFAGNFDFFLNSVSWTMEDETLISIRTKEADPGKVELSEKAARFIFLLTVLFIPFATASGGLAVWMVRRKL